MPTAREVRSGRLLLRGSWLLVLVVFLTPGCQHDPFAHFYTTEEPAQGDLLGAYRLTNARLDAADKKTLGAKTSVVELLADGSFRAENIPGHSGFALMSGTGRWNIETVGSIDFGTSVKKHWGARLQFDNGDLTWVGFANAKAPYSLIFTIGDPDSGHVLILKTSLDDPPQL